MHAHLTSSQRRGQVLALLLALSLAAAHCGRTPTAIPIGRPVAAYDGAEYNAIVYGRGALFFEALAQALGQPAFDAFLADYVQTHRWGIATPESLRALAETHCGCDLAPLFAEWADG